MTFWIVVQPSWRAMDFEEHVVSAHTTEEAAQQAQYRARSGAARIVESNKRLKVGSVYTR